MGALTFGVRSYLNISQLLPMLGSKAKYVRENAAVGSSYTPLAVFRGFCTPDTTSSILCAPCRKILKPVLRHKTLPVSPTSGS